MTKWQMKVPLMNAKGIREARKADKQWCPTCLKRSSDRMEQMAPIRCDVRIKAANLSIRPKPNTVGTVGSNFLLKKKNKDSPNAIPLRGTICLPRRHRPMAGEL